MVRTLPLPSPLIETEEAKLEEGEWCLTKQGPFGDFSGGALLRLSNEEEVNAVKRVLVGASTEAGGTGLGIEVTDARVLAAEANNSSRRGAARARPPARTQP